MSVSPDFESIAEEGIWFASMNLRNGDRCAEIDERVGETEKMKFPVFLSTVHRYSYTVTVIPVEC